MPIGTVSEFLAHVGGVAFLGPAAHRRFRQPRLDWYGSGSASALASAGVQTSRNVGLSCEGSGLDLVFPCGRLAWLFGRPAWALAAAIAAAGALAPLLAWPAGVGTSAINGAFVQCNAAGANLNVGYWFQLHWVIGFTIIIPAVLGVGAAASQRFAACVRILSKAGILGAQEGSLDARLASPSAWSRAGSISWLVRWGVPVVVVSVQIGAGWWPNVFGLFVRTWHDGPIACPSGPPFHPEVDWTIAALNWRSDAVSPIANLLFDVYAALLDLGSGFLITLWTTHMLVALCRLWSALASRHRSVAFEPMVFDPMRRLGLHALGRVYDSVFLGLTLLGLQSCLKHLSRMRRVEGIDELRYLTAGGHFSVGQIEVTMRTLDAVDLVTLSLACLSLIALLVLPSFTVMRLVNEYRDRLFCERIRTFEEASRTTADADKVFVAQFRALDGVHPWPNGDVAYLWIATYFALTAWAICPVGAPFVVSVGVAAKPVLAVMLGRTQLGGKSET